MQLLRKFHFPPLTGHWERRYDKFHAATSRLQAALSDDAAPSTELYQPTIFAHPHHAVRVFTGFLLSSRKNRDIFYFY
ncbi:hypothetical protein ACL2XP_02865 [Sodalis sp. RH21]|uniref:hypothetical protein n=1 Tax=unclassified Sodalis (in: enterobacteria) TaxID=2636512 RepID=UPI0039B379A9